MAKLQRLDPPVAQSDWQQAKLLARHAAAAVEAGTLGYTLLVASKPHARQDG